MRTLLLTLILFITGCSGTIVYNGKMPKTESGLKSYIAQLEVQIESYEEAIEDAKEYRTMCHENVKLADGYWATSDAQTKLSNADRRLDSERFFLQNSKSLLASAKIKLAELEE